MVELSAGAELDYASIEAELRALGFDSEPFGPRTIAIKAAPAGKFKASGTGQGGIWHLAARVQALRQAAAPLQGGPASTAQALVATLLDPLLAAVAALGLAAWRLQAI